MHKADMQIYVCIHTPHIYIYIYGGENEITIKHQIKHDKI